MFNQLVVLHYCGFKTFIVKPKCDFVCSVQFGTIFGPAFQAIKLNYSLVTYYKRVLLILKLFTFFMLIFDYYKPLKSKFKRTNNRFNIKIENKL